MTTLKVLLAIASFASVLAIFRTKGARRGIAVAFFIIIISCLVQATSNSSPPEVSFSGSQSSPESAAPDPLVSGSAPSSEPEAPSAAPGGTEAPAGPIAAPATFGPVFPDTTPAPMSTEEKRIALRDYWNSEADKFSTIRTDGRGGDAFETHSVGEQYIAADSASDAARDASGQADTNQPAFLQFNESCGGGKLSGLFASLASWAELDKDALLEGKDTDDVVRQYKAELLSQQARDADALSINMFHECRSEVARTYQSLAGKSSDLKMLSGYDF